MQVGLIVPNNPVTANKVTYTTSYTTYETQNFQVTRARTPSNSRA